MRKRQSRRATTGTGYIKITCHLWFSPFQFITDTGKILASDTAAPLQTRARGLTTTPGLTTKRGQTRKLPS
ncbi:MAG: hypothetical protein KFF73_02345 [Cyclobacteriaceae bacterium]|nr:hypothetical protein [Cyclobacteriaceae bacterium]